MNMWRQVLIVLPLALSALAIQVPVYGRDDKNTTHVYDKTRNTNLKTKSEIIDKKDSAKKANVKEFSGNKTIFYNQNQSDVMQSYLLPPTEHVPENVLLLSYADPNHEPSTYLLPPSPEKQTNYYETADPLKNQHNDWYPLQDLPLPIPPANSPSPVKLLPPNPPEVFSFLYWNNRSIGIIENPRIGKKYKHKRLIKIDVPSSELEPPSSSVMKNFKYINTLKAFPLETKNKSGIPYYSKDVPNNTEGKFPKKFQGKLKKNNIQLRQAEPTLALHLTPPKPGDVIVNKIATKLYPKKVISGFQPIPIPVFQYSNYTTNVSRPKPVNSFLINYEKNYNDTFLAQQKQKQRLENDTVQEQQSSSSDEEDTSGDNSSWEPETSETNYRHPGRNAYPAPLRQAPPSAPVAHDSHAPPAGERTEFRMHGMKGPHSYQFGYDTGKGKNRQFRYEERDNEGRVKGHYGYMDRDGKLRVVNYDADPEHGFRAEAPTETE